MPKEEISVGEMLFEFRLINRRGERFDRMEAV
jgi:hypothetical protein